MQKVTEILNLIEQYQTIIVHRHENPDPDALGSQGGLVGAIKAGFPDKKVLKAGGEVGDLAWFSTMDDVAKADYEGALVIIVDTANRPRISGEYYDLGKALVKIDHHPNDDVYGDIDDVDTTASSCSEMITEFILASNGKLVLNQEVAKLLYGGIVGDTGRFLFNNTTPHTLKMAQALLETGIDHSKISRTLSEVTFKQAKLQNFALELLTIDEVGMGSITITKELMAKLDITFQQAKAAVSTPGRLKEIKAWVTFVEQEDGEFRVHLRSKGTIINEIAKKHEGGGHPLASGAIAKDEAEMKQIETELHHAIENYSNED
ncbi:DHH family phosphoesterase [Holzapfeliella sp. JNUCC 72]